MLYNIRLATRLDSRYIEDIAFRSFKKFNLSEKGLSYNRVDTRKKIAFMSQGGIYQVHVAMNESNNIVGFVITAIHSTLYDDSKRQIIELGMQPDPSLSAIEQGRILVALINQVEKTAVDEGVNNIIFSICPEFDISKNLKRKKYKLTDMLYMKKIKD